MEQVGFYAEGQALTDMIRDLIQSGNFKGAKDILTEGGLSNEHIKAFFEDRLEFVGDTRENSDLEARFCEPDGDGLPSVLIGWRDRCKVCHRDVWDIFKPRPESSAKDLLALFDIYTEEEFKERFALDILRAEGYMIYKEPPTTHKVQHGIFLKDGTFIECGYQGHVFLYDKLYGLGLTNCRSWTDDKVNIHVSSGQYSGGPAYNLIKGRIHKEVDYQENIDMWKVVFKWRKHFNSFYSERFGSVTKRLIKTFSESLGGGAKFGNLVFLRDFYGIKIPQISQEPMLDNYCIRTSPKKSLPGILDSYFNVTPENNDEMIKKIKDTWDNANQDESLKALMNGNELNIFYQEYVEGANGVCHYKGEGEFTYDVGNQFDVVKGVVSNDGKISEEAHKELENIAKELYEDTRQHLQLEFVITPKDEVVIVQMRFIDTPTFVQNNVEKDGYQLVGGGISFTSGFVEVNLSECVVINGEIEPDDVKDAKAIIVRRYAEFSHALALSQSLNIPSLFNVGDVELPEKMVIDTRYKNGLIYKAS